MRRLMVPDSNAWSRQDDREVALAGDGESRLLIGGLNTAGQAKLWADAAATIPGVSSANLGAVRNGDSRFLADAAPSLNAMRHSPTWSKRQSAELMRGAADGGFSHVIIESVTPIMGTRFRRDLAAEVEAMTQAGVKPALVWHGTDIRDPGVHRSLNPDSPFNDELDGLTATLEESTKKHASLADRLDLLEFVSTPDLLEYRPNATWLPTLYQRELWKPPTGSQPKRHTPVVVHIPTRNALKGTDRIRAAMAELGDQIDFREIHNLSREQMVQAFSEADIVIDQLRMGLYGVTSIEAMAIAKPVVAQLGQSVRDRIKERTGQEVPIVEATGDNIAEVVAYLASDPDQREHLGAAGVAYVQRVHSPEVVAKTLWDTFLRSETR